MTKEFLSKMNYRQNEGGFDGRCSTDKEKDNSSATELFEIDKAASSPTIKKISSTKIYQLMEFTVRFACR